VLWSVCDTSHTRWYSRLAELAEMVHKRAEQFVWVNNVHPSVGPTQGHGEAPRDIA
jgi:hypothetical protein